MIDAVTGPVDEAPSQPPSGKRGQTQNQPSDPECSFQAAGPVIGPDVVTGSSASSHADGCRFDTRGIG